jgi:hypothetical protein
MTYFPSSAFAIGCALVSIQAAAHEQNCVRFDATSPRPAGAFQNRLHGTVEVSFSTLQSPVRAGAPTIGRPPGPLINRPAVPMYLSLATEAKGA